jgi:hypothetical protein
MVQLRPSALRACCRCSIIFCHASGPSCAQLMRMQSIPFSTSLWIIVESAAASVGIVTMIRAERPEGSGPKTSSVWRSSSFVPSSDRKVASSHTVTGRRRSSGRGPRVRCRRMTAHTPLHVRARRGRALRASPEAPASPDGALRCSGEGCERWLGILAQWREGSRHEPLRASASIRARHEARARALRSHLRAPVQIVRPCGGSQALSMRQTFKGCHAMIS